MAKTNLVLRNTSVLYELNSHIYINKLSQQYDRPISLANVPDSEIAKIADQGFDTVWLMGVWKRSPHARKISLNDQKFQKELTKRLPNLNEADFIGSAYAVQEYKVDEGLGGEAGLRDFRQRLQSLGVGLILDFVPNHTGPDHPWLTEHEDFYIHGSETDLAREPANYLRVKDKIIANGKDPTLPAWSDVIQLNIFSAGYRQSAISTLKYIAELCDGVRCDMAMMQISDLFHKAWGARAGKVPPQEYWQEVTSSVRKSYPDFIFIAEAYWQKEEILLSQGFNFCYDKDIYDFLFRADTKGVKQHLIRTATFQEKLARFIENHDEERAVTAYKEKTEAAAAVIATLPGVWLFHEGQLEGFKTKLPVHISRGPAEAINQKLSDWQLKLLKLLKDWQLYNGQWGLVETKNSQILAWQWTLPSRWLLVVINYSPKAAKATLPVKANQLHTDELSEASYQPNNLKLNLSLTPWQVLMLRSDS